MSTTFESFHLGSMLQVLRPDKGWMPAPPEDVSQSKEHVLDWRIPNTDLKVRVYTSVQLSDGWSRGVGEDAIRVCVPKRIKSVRIHRTEGWQKRLIERVTEVIEQVRTMEAKAPVEKVAAPKAPFLPTIPALLKTASAKLKHPKMTFQVEIGGKTQQVRLHVAGPRSRYNGQVMVTDGGVFGSNVYFGRIEQDGTFRRAAACTDTLETFLLAFNKAPAEVGAQYGKASGCCVFCNKGLTTDESLAVGYGPICAKHYQLPWGQK